MKKKFLPLSLLLCFFSIGRAQLIDPNYKLAVGLNLVTNQGGIGWGVSVKNFLDADTHAIEAFVSFSTKGQNLATFYECHLNIPGATGLRGYLGGGPVGSFYYSNKHVYEPFYFSVSGIVGLDFKFGLLPINISADLQPYYMFSQGVGTRARIALRYTLHNF